jgi:hypothetical protein
MASRLNPPVFPEHTPPPPSSGNRRSAAVNHISNTLFRVFHTERNHFPFPAESIRESHRQCPAIALDAHIELPSQHSGERTPAVRPQILFQTNLDCPLNPKRIFPDFRKDMLAFNRMKSSSSPGSAGILPAKTWKRLF